MKQISFDALYKVGDIVYQYEIERTHPVIEVEGRKYRSALPVHMLGRLRTGRIFRMTAILEERCVRGIRGIQWEVEADGPEGGIFQDDYIEWFATPEEALRVAESDIQARNANDP